VLAAKTDESQASYFFERAIRPDPKNTAVRLNYVRLLNHTHQAAQGADPEVRTQAIQLLRQIGGAVREDRLGPQIERRGTIGEALRIHADAVQHFDKQVRHRCFRLGGKAPSAPDSSGVTGHQ